MYTWFPPSPTHFLAFMKSPAVTLASKFSSGYVFSFILCRYLEVELLDYNGNFSAVPFYILTSKV